MAWALDARRTGTLSPDARLVLVALADYADPDGRGAFPAKTTLAERLGITPRAVQRHLATLREDGLIHPGDAQLVAHYRADRRPIVYDLNLGLEPPRGDASVTPPRGDSPGNGETEGDTTGRQSTTERGDSTVSQTNYLTTMDNPTPQTPHADFAAALYIDHARAEALACPRCLRLYGSEHQCHHDPPDPMPDNFRALVDAAREDSHAD